MRGWPEGLEAPPACAWDERTRCHRAPAASYADVVRALVASKTPYDDAARRYTELAAGARVHRDPRPYQTEALAAWRAHRGRGVVVLPTGAGKSHVAVLAIDDKRRSTLVVAPTLDLVRQWFDLLGATFGGPDRPRRRRRARRAAAHRHDVRLGVPAHGAPGRALRPRRLRRVPPPARAPRYALAARACLAPFRLGLTATPERTDGRDARARALIGPVVYRKDIVELSGDYLAEYETERVSIELSPDERAEHDAERAHLPRVRARATASA